MEPIVCKDKQCDIDLTVPVLLDDRKEIWEAGPKLPVCGQNTGEEKIVLTNFSAILILVRNNSLSADSKEDSVHKKIRDRSSLIFSNVQK